MNQIYRDVPLENIPWNLPDPPRLLQDAVDTSKIKPCRVVDLGCGAGNYSVWLAQRGFDVTGFDISEQAIRHAEKLASHEGASCRFVVTDLLDEPMEYLESFDLAIDWEVLHHIFPDDRNLFVENVARMLVPDGRYVSLCFHESDGAFGGKGKFRSTPMGTTLYFSSEGELRELFAPLFDIEDLSTVQIPGKYGSHMANLAWLIRK